MYGVSVCGILVYVVFVYGVFVNVVAGILFNIVRFIYRACESTYSHRVSLRWDAVGVNDESG